MDRNTLIGLSLMFLLTLGYFYFFAPKPEDRPPAQPPAQEAPANKPTESLSASQPAQISEAAASPSADSISQSLYGPFSKAMKNQPDRAVTVRTEMLELKLHTSGAQIRPVVLRKFKTWDGKPLTLVQDHESNQTSFQLRYRGQVIDTRSLHYEASADSMSLAGKESRKLRLRATLGRDTFVEHEFTFHGNRYDFSHVLRLKGVENLLTDNYLYITQLQYAPRTEKSVEKMLPEIQLCYKYSDASDVERLDISEDEIITDRPTRDVAWIANKSQFFTAALLADDRFQNPSLSLTPNLILDKNPALDVSGKALPAPPNSLKIMRSEAALPIKKGAVDSVGLRHFYGPNEIGLMQGYDNSLDGVVQLGWGPLRYIALFLRFIFQTLAGFISSYGIIIFVLAVIIKVMLHPLTARSFRSTAKMQLVNEMPEMKELEEKYADNPTELQQRKLAFYNQLGISPLGGCLPLLLQFPILISMFNFFPQSIELRQQAFLWADDLSTYDSVYDFGFNIPFYGDHVSLFTLLMTLSTILYTYMQQKTQANNTPAQLKIISYLMPVIFLGILNNYSAGLSYYYLVFNILTIGHTLILKQFMDKEKLHAQILETKQKKSKKPEGRIQKWMADQQKKQQQLQQQQQKNRGRR